MSLRRDNFRLAFRNLQAAKGRSFLTMFGTIVGVMAVVLVVCIGQGVKEQIAGQLGQYGSNLFVAEPGARQTSVSLLTGLSGSNSSLLTADDLHTLQKTQGVADAVPLSTVSGSITGDHTVNTPFIIATTAQFPDVIHQAMLSGGFFQKDDTVQTAVLGIHVAQKLFNENAPLGQAMLWHGQRFIVAGVFDDFKAPPFSLEANFNDAVFIPYATAQHVSGSALGIYEIIGKPSSAANADQTVAAANAALVSAHGGAQDVRVSLATAANSASDQTIHLLTLLVAGAALIALIVGGVGIMDVMLVSVTERMYEIGLRKAIGATNGQIMRQFVAEAFVLSGMGALIAVILSCAGVGLLRAFTSLQAVIVWQILVIAPLLAMAIGVLFGSLPALKAARKDPIEALRHD